MDETICPTGGMCQVHHKLTPRAPGACASRAEGWLVMLFGKAVVKRLKNSRA